MNDHKHLKHISRIWVKDPIFFITCCTHQKKPILASAKIVSILVEEGTGALDRHGWTIGRYVVMPDHVHFFCTPVSGITDPAYKKATADPAYNIETAGSAYKDLSGFIQQWKQWTSKRIIRECIPDDQDSSDNICSPDGSCNPDFYSPDGSSGLLRFTAPIWQAEFFDHLLRSQKSYSQKWEYVRFNPVRAALVKVPEEWLWQGQIQDIL
jgi:putative transposase